MEAPEDERELSLSAEKRQISEERIVRATMATMAQRGFSVTIDEIAAVAGMSPRTIYRYFDTRDQLIAAGMRGMLKACNQPIPGLPSVTDDLDGWIDRIALTAAARNATIFGAAFWDFARPTPSGSKEIEEAKALRRPTRMEWMNGLSAIAWMAAGGEGEPPASVVTTFALALSVFTLHALVADFGYGPEESAEFAASMIKEHLAAAVDAQRHSSRSASKPT
jgi:AcrR family transcriptional regulator